MPFNLSVRAKRVIIIIIVVMVGGSLIIPARSQAHDPFPPAVMGEAATPR